VYPLSENELGVSLTSQHNVRDWLRFKTMHEREERKPILELTLEISVFKDVSFDSVLIEHIAHKYIR
jgi:hypothetical protein